MQRIWTILFCTIGCSSFALGADRPKREPAFRSAFSNSNQSAMWLSPTQIYQINGNRVDWSLHNRSEVSGRIGEDTERGDQSTFMGNGISGGLMSRYPSAAAGRIGLLFNFEKLEREDAQVSGSAPGRLKVLPSPNGESRLAQSTNRGVLEPVFAYTFWNMLTVGGSIEFDRLQARNGNTVGTFDTPKFKAGVGVFSAVMEAALFAEVPREPIVSFETEADDVADGIPILESGRRAFNVGGALLRMAIVSDWNLGAARIYSQERAVAAEDKQADIIQDRVVLEFVGDSGSLEGYYESSQNFRAKHPADEVVEGTARRWGASLLLKSETNARYGISFSSISASGRSFGLSGMQIERQDVWVEGREMRILGYIPL